MEVVAVRQLGTFAQEGGDWGVVIEVGGAADGHIHDHPDTQHKVCAIRQQGIIHEDIVAHEANKHAIANQIGPLPLNKPNIKLIIGPLPQKEEYPIKEPLTDDQVKPAQVRHMYEQQRRHQKHHQVTHQKDETLNLIRQIDEHIHILTDVQLAVGVLAAELGAETPVPFSEVEGGVVDVREVEERVAEIRGRGYP